MSNNVRILIADNDPVWREFAAYVLCQAGYEVEICLDVPEALQKIKEDGFDLIIVDAPLLDLLNLLSAEPVRHRLLVVSAAPSVPEAISAYRGGALDYVNKAFGEASILQTITTVLAKPPARRTFPKSLKFPLPPVGDGGE
ncbi:MAG: response regulator [Chloroflexota bacterium]